MNYSGMNSFCLVVETKPNKENTLSAKEQSTPDSLDFWAEAYFRLEVSTQKKSKNEQKRDISLFLDFMQREEGTLDRIKWTPRLSGAFIDYLQSVHEANGERRWSNRTINRIIAHLKTWTKGELVPIVHLMIPLLGIASKLRSSKGRGSPDFFPLNQHIVPLPKVGTVPPPAVGIFWFNALGKAVKDALLSASSGLVIDCFQ